MVQFSTFLTLEAKTSHQVREQFWIKGINFWLFVEIESDTETAVTEDKARKVIQSKIGF